MKDYASGDKTKSMVGTLVVLRLLCGLHGLPDLHADDVDLCLAVLQHLLSRLEKLLVLRRDRKNRRRSGRVKEHRLNTRAGKVVMDHKDDNIFMPENEANYQCAGPKTYATFFYTSTLQVTR